jgi:hypothetical protein
LKIASNRQVSPAKPDRPTSSKRSGQTSTNSSSTTGKVRIGSGKSSATSTGRPTTGKGNREKLLIDINKPHWILRVVSDADKSVKEKSKLELIKIRFFFYE